MSKRRERGVFVLMTVLSLVALGFLMGCPPFRAREQKVIYQEVGLIQLADRFVPSEIVLVAGRPARIHVTNTIDAEGQRIEIPAIMVGMDLKRAEIRRIELSPEQLQDLGGKVYRCPQTGNQGTFRIVQEGEPIQSKEVDGAVEVAVVMTDKLAAPHNIYLRKGVPVRLYLAKTKGEEDMDWVAIAGFGRSEEMEDQIEIQDGQVTSVEFTPEEVGTVQFYSTTTPKSNGTIHVVE